MKITRENCEKEMKGIPCIVENDFYGVGKNREGFISKIDPNVGFTISDLETEKELFCTLAFNKTKKISYPEEKEDYDEMFFFVLNFIYEHGKISFDDYKNQKFVQFHLMKLAYYGPPTCAFK